MECDNAFDINFPAVSTTCQQCLFNLVLDLRNFSRQETDPGNLRNQLEVKL
jgi:hypothetical protein